MRFAAQYRMAAVAALTLVTTGALLSGCSTDRRMMSPTATGAALTVSPADGATAVRLDAPVVLTFGAPVDRGAVERNLHLISERAMTDSACPDPATMAHPDMEHCMADTVMMRHLDTWHATPGRFSWNGAGTVCTFQPDSMMAPGARQMIHLDRGMMEMLGGMGGGTMGGHGTGMMRDHMMLHFTTLADPGGHDDHH